MRRLFRWIRWIIRVVVFFVLFAFAINNLQEATLHWMFGHEWQAPMTLIVLVAFALGVAVGVLGMLPDRWKRRHAKAASTPASAPPPSATAQSMSDSINNAQP